MTPHVDKVFRDYFERHGQATARGSLVPGEQPGAPIPENRRDHQMARLGDKALLMRGITADEFLVLAERFSGNYGQRESGRWTRKGTSADSLAPDEEFTAETHPDDPEMVRVVGKIAREPGPDEIGKALGMRQSHAAWLLASARRKVRENVAAMDERAEAMEKRDANAGK